MTEQKSFRVILFSPVFLLTLCVASFFIFWNLGVYSFWDDEAIDGLIARSLIENGRAKAIIGENLLGYREGALLHNLQIVGQPPFCAFAAVPCFKLFGQIAWSGRLVPALAGIATVFLMLTWVFQKTDDRFLRLLFCLSLLGNTSFFLFARQFHYYGPSMLFTVLIAYIWTQPKSTVLKSTLIGTSLFCLNLNNYLSGFLVGLALAADYVFFKRSKERLRHIDILAIVIPVIASGMLIYFDWNPFRTILGEKLTQNTFRDKITLFTW